MSGSASLLWRIVGSAPVGGFVPLPVRILLQIRCCGHICGEPCLVVYGHQWDGSFVAAVDVAGNIGVVQNENIQAAVNALQMQMAGVIPSNDTTVNVVTR